MIGVDMVAVFWADRSARIDFFQASMAWRSDPWATRLTAVKLVDSSISLTPNRRRGIPAGVRWTP